VSPRAQATTWFRPWPAASRCASPRWPGRPRGARCSPAGSSRVKVNLLALVEPYMLHGGTKDLAGLVQGDPEERFFRTVAEDETPPAAAAAGTAGLGQAGRPKRAAAWARAENPAPVMASRGSSGGVGSRARARAGASPPGASRPAADGPGTPLLTPGRGVPAGVPARLAPGGAPARGGLQ
jgi:hypothetical protein